MMDSMQLEILIEVRNTIAARENGYICHELYISCLERFETTIDRGEYLQELFPEFFSLYDGRYWFMDGYSRAIGPPNAKEADAWWQGGFYEARLDILDFLIANRSM